MFQQLSELRVREKMVADLIIYIGERSGELKVHNETPLPHDVDALQRSFKCLFDCMQNPF